MSDTRVLERAVEVEMRTCTICDESMPVTAFRVRKNTRGVLYPLGYCKRCESQKEAERRASPRHKANKLARRIAKQGRMAASAEITQLVAATTPRKRSLALPTEAELRDWYRGGCWL